MVRVRYIDYKVFQTKSATSTRPVIDMHRMSFDVWVLFLLFVGPYAQSPVSCLLADMHEIKIIVQVLPRILPLLNLTLVLFISGVCLWIVYTMTEESQWVRWYKIHLSLYFTYTLLSGSTLPHNHYSNRCGELKWLFKSRTACQYINTCWSSFEQAWSHVRVFMFVPTVLHKISGKTR